MHAAEKTDARYARVIEVSKRVRWEIERDVIRGRRFDFSKPFMPARLSLVDELAFLSVNDRRLMSQVQGRTYAYMFGLVERFIGAKVLDVSRKHWFGSQVALEALVRMTDEELKHQELFRRIETAIEAAMPAGYVRTADPDTVANVVLTSRTWAVLALTLDIELFTQAHYRASIDPQAELCPLWKDVFLFHWREESQHAILDELELLSEDEKLSCAQRDQAVGDLIGLVGAVDATVKAQAAADAEYFIKIASRPFVETERAAIHALVLKAYRWQYIVSGAMEPRFQKILFSLINGEQAARVQDALTPLSYAVPAQPEMALPMVA